MQVMMLRSWAILEGATSPSGWQISCMAEGANPKGRESVLPNSVVVISGWLMLFNTRGTIINRWKLVSFSCRVCSSLLPESRYSKAALGRLASAACLKSSRLTHWESCMSNYIT
jgi:hypothetical protein